MKFDDLDGMMRQFEESHDHCVLPGIWMVARLDGRSFTRLTKEVFDFERPFDVRFRDFMVATTEYLMTAGFNVIYGYTQSDEISLLFDRDESIFSRKLRKFNSVLAGEASAKFTMLAGEMGTFDCRISQLTTDYFVRDYFRWRQADAHRNALNGHCYWMLRDQGLSARKASSQLSGMSVSDKNELLFQNGINFNDLPAWQKRGSGLYWETYEKEGHNPITNETVVVERRRITTDFELPYGDPYDEFIDKLLLANSLLPDY